MSNDNLNLKSQNTTIEGRRGQHRKTIEFLGIWVRLNNPDFKPIEFDGFRNQAGLNSFILTPKQWIEKTNAIGIISKAGCYGGTYAHKDIAFAQLTQIPWGRISRKICRMNSDILCQVLKRLGRN